MSQWVIKGLRTRIKTMRYPAAMEDAAGITPGRPMPAKMDTAAAEEVVQLCPTQALMRDKTGVAVDYARCVHCYRCARAPQHPLPWDNTYEWATFSRETDKFESPFHRSIHIVVFDAGDCGACLNEIKQLNNPYYNMHRLGFFITPAPRHADVLMVVGPVTDHIREALLKTYNAMAAPKRVIAVGACALSGGIFAESFVCSKGLSEVLPVDIEVPGNPPPPLAILHGLLVAVGRKAPAIEA